MVVRRNAGEVGRSQQQAGMPERVLIVAHAHPEFSLGGGEIVAYQLFDSLRSGGDVDAFFLAGADPSSTAAEEPGLRRVDGRRDEMLLSGSDVDPFLFVQRAPQAAADFTALLKRLKPDIVHFHHYWNLGADLFTITRNLLPNARLIVTLHEYHAICAHWGQMVKPRSLALCGRASSEECARCFPDRTPAAFARRERLIKAHFSRVDAFIAPSRFLAERYIAWGLPEERVRVIENALPPVAASPRAASDTAGRSVFGFFGQINPFKGLLQLLSAFEQLQSHPELHLRLHGAYLELNDPQFIAEFQLLLQRNADRVTFSGAYRREDLSRLMAEVDWVVVPSLWWENAPLVIEEAIAHRRPVICSNIGGMAEKVRPGLDGLHFPVGDVAALARTLLYAGRTPGLGEQFQRTMRAQPSFKAFVGGHLSLYNERPAAAPRRQSPLRADRSSTIQPRVVATAESTLSTAQVIGLDAGVYAISVALAAPPSIDKSGARIHLSPLAANGTTVTLVHDGTAADAWFGPEGGKAVLVAVENGVRLVVMVYRNAQTAPIAATVTVQRIAETPPRPDPWLDTGTGVLGNASGRR